MLFIEDNQVWESFVYVPKKPIAINPDGSWNTQKVCELVVKAKAGDEQAIMQLFEQYQYLWKATVKAMIKDGIEYEDAQQDVFVTLMEALQNFNNSPEVFSGYYEAALGITLIKKTVQESKHRKNVCSLDERDENGNLKHEVSITEIEGMTDLGNVRRLLTDIEFKVVVAHYLWDVDFKTIAEHFDLTPQYMRLLNMWAKEKLKVLL